MVLRRLFGQALEPVPRNSNPPSQCGPSARPLPRTASARLWGFPGWPRGGGPLARPAPGRRLERPARLRGLGSAWPRRPALRGLRRQVSLPSIPAPTLGARRAAAAWSGRAAGPASSPGPGTESSRKPAGASFSTARDCHPQDGAAAPRREGAFEPGERHPGATESPKLTF